MGTYAALADADLVRQAKAGDRNAFAVLYDRYFDGLHDFLTRMTRNRVEAAELVQDTFLVAMQRLESLQQPARFKSRLFQIAYRRSLDRLEKRSRWQLTSQTPGEDGETRALLVQSSPDRLDDPAHAAEAEVATRAWEAARALDDRTFALLDLHVRQGLSSAEIAGVLNVTPNRANLLVHQVKDRVADAGTPAPLHAYGALAAVPAATGVKDEIWRNLDRAWPTGKPPSLLDTWRHVAVVVGAVLLIAVLPIGLVLGFAGDGSAAPVAIDPLTASPVDRTPEAATSFGVGPGLLLPPPPQYEPPAATEPPTAEPTETDTGTPEPGIPPVVIISQPIEGALLAANGRDGSGPYAAVTLEGAADDPDSSPDSLAYAWSSDIDGPLADAPAGSARLHVSDYAGQCGALLDPLLGKTAETTHLVTLTVTDETGAVGQRAVHVTVQADCNNGPSPSPTPTDDPSFTLSCNQPTSAQGPNSYTSTCVASADDGFSGPIQWSCAGSPQVSCSVGTGPSDLPSGGENSRTVTISAGQGSWSVTVKAVVNGVEERTFTLSM